MEICKNELENGKYVYKIAGGRECSYCKKSEGRYIIGNINTCDTKYQFCDNLCFKKFITMKETITILCHYCKKDNPQYVTYYNTSPLYYYYCNNKCWEKFIDERTFNEKHNNLCETCNINESKIDHKIVISSGYGNSASCFLTIYFCSIDCMNEYRGNKCCNKCCRVDFTSFKQYNNKLYCTSTFVNSPPTCHEIESKQFIKRTEYCKGCEKYDIGCFVGIYIDIDKFPKYVYLCINCIKIYRERNASYCFICNGSLNKRAKFILNNSDNEEINSDNSDNEEICKWYIYVCDICYKTKK